MWKKIASLSAMLSAFLTVSGCQTAMYKPIICQPGTALKHGRCEKVSRAVQESSKAREQEAKAKPKYRPKTVTGADGQAPADLSIKQSPPKQDVYGRPIAK